MQGFFEQKSASPTRFALVAAGHARRARPRCMLAAGPQIIRALGRRPMIDFDPAAASSPSRTEPAAGTGRAAATCPAASRSSSRSAATDLPPLPPSARCRHADADRGRHRRDRRFRPPHPDPPAAGPRATRGSIRASPRRCSRNIRSPSSARSASGTVVIRVTIGTDGRVRAAERVSATSDAFWDGGRAAGADPLALPPGDASTAARSRARKAMTITFPDRGRSCELRPVPGAGGGGGEGPILALMPLPRPASPRALWEDMRALLALPAAPPMGRGRAGDADPGRHRRRFLHRQPAPTPSRARRSTMVESWPANRTDEQIKADQNAPPGRGDRRAEERARAVPPDRQDAEPAGHLSDERWMAAAIALGERGRGRTAPNPHVGCLIVRDETRRRPRLDPAGRPPACRGGGARRGRARRRAARPSMSRWSPARMTARAARPAPTRWSRPARPGSCRGGRSRSAHRRRRASRGCATAGIAVDVGVCAPRPRRAWPASSAGSGAAGRSSR